MKRFFFLATCLTLISGPAAWADIPPEQGGPGTIDPATVTTHQIVHFSLGSVPGEAHTSRVLGTDSAGNHIVGSVLRYSAPNQFSDPTPRIRSVVSKFDRSNNLLWSRERTTSGNAEQWGDGQPPVVYDSTGFLSLEVAGIVVDAQENVIVAFNTFQPTFDPNTNRHGLERSQITLVAKFDSAGTLIWRRSTNPNFATNSPPPPYYYVASEVRSLALGKDGTPLVLIDNYQSGSSQNEAHESLVLKLTSTGTILFLNRYGADENANPQFSSTPTALCEDIAGNLYLVSTEYPWPDNAAFAKYMNVLRKIGPGGDLLKEHDVALYPGLAADANNVTREGWNAARVDSAGNLYVGGSRYRPRPSLNGPDQGESEQLVLKFAPDLTQVWRTLGPQSKGKFSGQAFAVVTDLQLSSGGAATGITVGGWWQNGGSGASQEDDHWEISRLAFDDGHVIWHRLYQAPVADPNYGSDDRLAAFRVDASGNVYASGWVARPSGPGTPALIKYSDAGDLQFVKPLPNGTENLSVLYLPSATNRPTFVGAVATADKEVAVTEVDNPPVVGGKPDVFGNISTRVKVGAGDNVLIGGFIVNGSQGATKKVLVRAIGPSLNNFGLAGLPDPVLELHDSAGNVMINDNWQAGGTFNQQPYASQKDEIQAASLAPSDLNEAAMIVTVPAGNTTAIIRSKTASNSGTAVIEVYDLEQNSLIQLANIATRGKVELGNDPMIAGIIVLGQNPQDILIRAVGPSLAAAGVANTLQDPNLGIYDANGATIALNDDWHVQSGNPQGGDVSILAPNDDRESALRVTLMPASYTAIVRAADKAPANQKTGVALIEAYHLQ